MALSLASAFLVLYFHPGPWKIVDRNASEAVRCLQVSSAKGTPFSQVEFACCLANDPGVTQNQSQAVAHFKVLADQGNASAQTLYGVCLEHALGICQNEGEGARYYTDPV
jgi:TPR repeat protein